MLAFLAGGDTFDFKDPGALGVSFDVAPERAASFFRSKGLIPTHTYKDLNAAQHAVDFTVAKLLDMALLGDVAAAMDQAIADGKSLKWFQNNLTPILEKGGWWGKTEDGQQLGSAWRLETIFRSNMQSAYSVGEWERITDNADVVPWLMYDSIEDSRRRPAHAEMDGTVLPVKHRWWLIHMPPNGYNCRCSVISLTTDEMEALGLKPTKGRALKLIGDPDDGWSYNPGVAHLAKLEAIAVEQAGELPGDLARAAGQGLEASKRAAKQAATLDLFPITADLPTKAATALQKAAEAKALADAIAKAAAAKQARANAKALAQLDDYANASPNTNGFKGLKAAKQTDGFDDLQPADQLALVEQQIEAVKAYKKQAAGLAGYQKKAIAGETPTPAQLQAFDNLADTEQALLLQKIDEQKAIKAAAIAKAKAQSALDDYLGELVQKPALNPGKQLLNKGALDELIASDDPAKALVQIRELIKTTAEANAAKIGQKVSLTFYVKAMAKGKKPAPKGQAAYDALSDTEKADIDAKIAALKAADEAPEPVQAPNQPPPAASLDDDTIPVDRLVKVGGQSGSNPGGLYKDPDTGRTWYIKHPSQDRAEYETLAGKLYQAAGVDVPDMQTIDFNGKPSIASRIIDGLSTDRSALLTGKVSGANDNFLVDAWLANWDVVGLGYDNLLVKAGRAVRIDTGGALKYRAQGSVKQQWGDDVIEIDSLRDPAINPQSAAVFASVTDAQMLSAARRIAAIDEDQIRAMVNSNLTVADAAERAQLVATLMARRAAILKRFPDADKPDAPAPVATTKAISGAEFQRITDSRSNGYAIPTDKGDIEDQNVLIWHETSAQGNPRSSAYFKLRPDAAALIDKQIGDTGASPEPAAVRLANLAQSLTLKAVKGIGKYHAELGDIRTIDIERVNEAAQKVKNARLALQAAEDTGQLLPGAVADFDTNVVAWLNAAQKAVAPGVGKLYDWTPPFAKMHDLTLKVPPPEPGKAGAITWKKTSATFPTRSFKNGRATETAQTSAINVIPHRYEAIVDGVKVYYYPNTETMPFALRGRVVMQKDGATLADSEALLNTIKTLGIDNKRPTDMDREELYLNRLAYRLRDNYLVTIAKASGEPDQAKRIGILRAELSGQVGGDVTKLQGYNVHGEYQAFGHGRANQYAPITEPEEWQDFTRDMRLIHRNTNDDMLTTLANILGSGGQMAPSTDKLRRGIRLGGMSPGADLQSGGASYFFTRLRRTNQIVSGDEAFVWRSDLVRRMDAISYNSDMFGRTTGNTVISERRVGVDEWRAAANNGSNETIFKDSLSIFDNLDYIKVGKKNRAKALALFRQNGINQWPDGRKLEDVIRA